MEYLLRTRYASAKKVTLVCDNLNTHTKGAFYESFEPAKARSLIRQLEFCHTPKHGSWLNIAENELSSMTRQCVAGQLQLRLTTGSVNTPSAGRRCIFPVLLELWWPKMS